MFGSSKPTASLSSGLLARKGQARPAMRPQGFHGPAVNLDDLGWNDMGTAASSAEPVVTVVPPASPVVADEPAPMPQVLVEREALAQELETPAAVRPVSVATAARLRRETAHATKSAFTLRLDQERHLRLRLASALTNNSAQTLVTRALDQFLASLPDVDALVAQLPPAKRTR